MNRYRFLIALWPDLVEAAWSLHRTFRGDLERARIVLAIACDHAWRLEYDHQAELAERARKEGQPPGS